MDYALVVKGCDGDGEYVYIPEECSLTTTTIADVNDKSNNATVKHNNYYDSSVNTITVIPTPTSMFVDEN